MKSKKVLIVDDNDLNRKLFENLVGQLYDFQSAHNGMEAIELASKTPFDLILMDIQMPRMDGITAMKKIREIEYGSCPILAVTAFADEGDRQHFLNQGFDDFIAKPIRPREFILTIQSLFRKSTSSSQETSQEKQGVSQLNEETLAQLLKYNSKEAIKKVYLDFIEECKEAILMIEQVATQGVSSDLLDKIHTLKGNSGTLGAEKIHHRSQNCETLGRQNNQIEFLASVSDLRNDLIEFQNYFSNQPIFES
jgi:CheY-like chemotaxis protein/HPt (histidine-containing phosphotransfer) domain-containing protein